MSPRDQTAELVTSCLDYIGSDDLLIVLLTRVCLFSLQALLFHCHAFRVWQDP